MKFKQMIPVVIILLILMGVHPSFSESIQTDHSLYLKKTNNHPSNNSSCNLIPGDIVWRWSYIPFITHCLLYVGQNEEHMYGFIEANSLHNVWNPSYDINWMQSELFSTICRVDTNETIREKAIQFAQSQVGKNFSYIHEKEFDPDTEDWYCTEIVWAAYYSQGIDIDVNGWHENPFFDAPVILPYEIYLDSDITIFQLTFT